MRRAAALAVFAVITACGGDKKEIDAAVSPTIDAKVTADAATIDAKPLFDARVDAKPADAAVDAKPSTVQVLASCAGQTPALTVTISGTPTLHYVLTGSNPIAPNDVVEFKTLSIHDAKSGTPPNSPDGQFHVDFNKDQCLKFTQGGSFPFYCSVHLFTATITVQ